MKFYLAILITCAVGALSERATVNSICKGVVKLSHDLNDTYSCFHDLKANLHSVDTSHTTPTMLPLSNLVGCLRQFHNTVNDTFALDTEKKLPDLKMGRSRLQEVITRLEGSQVQEVDFDASFHEIGATYQRLNDIKGILDKSLIMRICSSTGKITERSFESATGSELLDALYNLLTTLLGPLGDLLDMIVDAIVILVKMIVDQVSQHL
ncbi:hypothetical protein N7481_001174 [Penicillium waksmanii]|uniref:uncharacterized protein n=1 Tax=Penicillium waksmanii TaxID=69791 RepID=UPI002549AED9|nr:uncharacterized protein N7481_001174 [Penicillium waksmanii]KAJ6000765.1 hypothetical protein N7481_001174 [Penicillium waksmanii]